MNFGFSYIGLIYLVMLMLPNIIWTRHKPEDYEKYVTGENKVLLVMERIGEALVFFAGTFIYSSNYDELSEHEFDYVFIYVVDSAFYEIKINPSEVSSIMWLTVNEIEKWIEQTPNDFSSWFSRAFDLAKKSLENL